MSEKRPCVSCGNRVPDAQEYPYPGHKSDCKLVNEWQKNYPTVGLTDEDFLVLESAKSMCHGGGGAARLAAQGEGSLNPAEIAKMLRVHQVLLQKICDKLGGWERLKLLGGPKKLVELREKWEAEIEAEGKL